MIDTFTAFYNSGGVTVTTFFGGMFATAVFYGYALHTNGNLRRAIGYG